MRLRLNLTRYEFGQKPVTRFVSKDDPFFRLIYQIEHGIQPIGKMVCIGSDGINIPTLARAPGFR